MIGQKNSAFFADLLGDMTGEDLLCLGALLDGIPAGCAVFSQIQRTAVLEYLYVEEKLRRQGVAAELLRKVIHGFQEAGIDHILAYYDEDPALTGTLQSAGFVTANALPHYSIKVSDIEEAVKNQLFEKSAQSAGQADIRSIGDAMQRTILRFGQALQQAGYSDEVLEPGHYDPELSLLMRAKDESPLGILLAERYQQTDYLVTALQMFDRPGSKNLEVLSLFLAFYHKIRETAPGGENAGRIHFYPDNPKILRLFESLLGENGPVLENNGMQAVYGF